MKKYLVLFALIIIQGCSSGGGDSASQVAIPLDTSDIRAYQQGDTLTVTINMRDIASGNTATGTVTYTLGYTIPNPYGIDCRQYMVSGTITGPNGTSVISSAQFFYQDSNNSLYDCGKFDDDLNRNVFLTDNAETPNGLILELESPVQLGNSISGIAFFDDGSWEDCTSTVQSKENVSVPLGFYETYKIYETCSYSDGTTYVGTYWRVPSIFNIKESGLSDGVSIELLVTSYSYK